MNFKDMVPCESYFVENNDGVNKKDDILIYLKGKTKAQFLNLTTKTIVFCKVENIGRLKLDINALQDSNLAINVPDNVIVKGNGGGSDSNNLIGTQGGEVYLPLEEMLTQFPQDAENNEYRYIDPAWLNEIAIGLTAGAEKHPGETETWRQIPCDEHLARALRHINLYRMGDRLENHLANASMRLMMSFATQEVGKDD